jgi:hypothetical protein
MRLRSIAYGMIAVLAFVLTVLVLRQTFAASTIQPVLNSPQPPADASPPESAEGNGEKMLPYFDDYSWRAFIAMVWPAASGRRGVPDQTQTVASKSQPKVFETFKAAWETFRADSQGTFIPGQPAVWGVYEDPQYNACSHKMQYGDLVLASFSKFSDMSQAGLGTVDQSICAGHCGPLMARNRTFLHYLTGYNEKAFNVVRQWLFNNPHPTPQGPAYAGIAFPSQQVPGASPLTVKSAWMDMTGFNASQRERYYIRKAWVLDLGGSDSGGPATCSEKEVGLVGLHIVQRTFDRPQWIWSTFEQVDNVPPRDPLGSDGSFALYAPGAPALGAINPYPQIPTHTVSLPFYSVVRRPQIHPLTYDTNLAYRSKLREAGSVWQYYQLVMTQFPTGIRLSNPDGANPKNWYPGAGADRTSFANVTMETFHQTGVAVNSCLGCHSHTRVETDFVWSVFTRPRKKVPGLSMLEMLELKDLLSAQGH